MNVAFLSIDLFLFDPSITPGSVLNVVCHIRWNKCNRTSADLKFVLDFNNTKITVSKNLIEIINTTTVELNYPDVPLHFDGAYISCQVGGRRKRCRERDRDKLNVACESVLLCVSFSSAYPFHVACFARSLE